MQRSPRLLVSLIVIPAFLIQCSSINSETSSLSDQEVDSLFNMPSPGTFKTEQLRYSRVREAYDEKWNSVASSLIQEGINSPDFELGLVAYKLEKALEVWLKPKGKETFILFKTIQFCSSSGSLGPKRKQGDYQIPEGMYHIDRFNPHSNFWLSLGINYPNQSDATRKTASNSGGDIFIHGSCVTVGCIPITDNLIKELYILAVEARDNGQSRIPVLMFPFRMTDKKMADVSDHPYFDFWSELKPFYDHFNNENVIPRFRIDSEGKYIVIQ